MRNNIDILLKKQAKFFFLKHAGELHIYILRIKDGLKHTATRLFFMGKTWRNNPNSYILHYPKQEKLDLLTQTDRAWQLGEGMSQPASPRQLPHMTLLLTEDRKPFKLGCWPSKTQLF
jgi:hypothetical protein